MTTKLDEAMLDGLTEECKTPQDVAALYTQMLQRVLDRGLNAELDAHLGYERHDKASDGPRGNTRNGTTPKRVINTLRDRNGTFEPAGKGVRFIYSLTHQGSHCGLGALCGSGRVNAFARGASQGLH